MTVETPERARPEPIKAVPVRHPGRWVAIAVLAVLLPKSRGGTPEMYEEFKKYMKDACYEAECSDEMIAACPGGAISKEGIDRKACQEYCKTIFKHVPTPDLCGKCYFCK